MKNLILIFFILSIFSSLSAQEYNLEMSFEINYDGDSYSENDEYLQEYYIKNKDGEVIGSLVLDSSKQNFKYFNLDKKIVATEYNLGLEDTPFDNRDRQLNVLNQLSRKIIFIKMWNDDQERFDLYSINDTLIGSITENLETPGVWDLKSITGYRKSMNKAFIQLFETESEWITGYIENSSGDGLSRAKVQVGSNPVVYTDKNGYFRIKANKGDVLKISSKNFKSKYQSISSKKFIVVGLTKNVGSTKDTSSNDYNRSSSVSKSKNITGFVKGDDGPLLGAFVLVKGTNSSATTDFRGNFTITASQGDVLLVSYSGYKLYSITIGSRNNYFVRLTPKKTKNNKKSKKRKNNKKFNADGVSGLGFNISLYNSELTPPIADVLNLRIGLEYHGISNDRHSLGLTTAAKRSDTFVSDEYDLIDYDLAVTYGHSLGKLLKLKVGLGYYTYNFNTTESFGAFYDFGGGVYYSAGLQLFIPLGKSGITLDGFYDNDGLGYGLGFKF